MKPPQIDSSASCGTDSIGTDCQIGSYTLIAATASLGTGVTIGSSVTVPDGVVLEDGVVIEDGARLCPGVVIEADARIGANAVFLPQPGPGSGLAPTRVRRGARVGSRAILHPGLTIGQHAVIGEGAVISQDVPAQATVPGRDPVEPSAAGWSPERLVAGSPVRPEVFPSAVRGVQTYRLPVIIDPRGNLSVAEFGRHLPFLPKRFFMTFEVPGEHLRGEHAHRECDQFLLCVKGACSVAVDDGNRREEYRLDHPVFGIRIPPMVWATEYDHSPDSVLVVFASHYYDPEDYIRDYDEFLLAVRTAADRDA